MATHPMAAVDAQFYWMSAKIPNDQFLLYAFAGQPSSFDRAIEDLRGRAQACPDLTMRVDDRKRLSYPRWVPTTVAPSQIVTHQLADDTWSGCLNAVVGLADQQLDLRRMAWRLHVFNGVRGIPTSAGPAAVAVMQVGHALADGTRAAALAGWLFGRSAPVAELPPPSPGYLLWRAAAAARAHWRMADDVGSGRLPPPSGSRPPLATNARPAGVRALRTLVRHRSRLPGPTVTVGVLTAVSTALSNHLDGPRESLGAEVPMTKPGPRQARNHFANAVVGLHPQLPPDVRARRIAAELANARRRGEHQAARSSDRAFAAVPAPLLRWGVSQFDPDARALQVSGNTVVSSVHRGAADLHFGDAPVLLTAGYPALSPAMGLTHGVHGIGDTVAISVHAAESAVGDIDCYLRRLDAAL